jgi:predicted RNA-binding protein with EMAP domain
MQLGAATVKLELMKLQVSYKENVLGGHVDRKKSQEVIKQLVRQLDELRKAQADERELNDRNSFRLKEMAAKVTALEDAIKWMRSQEAA